MLSETVVAVSEIPSFSVADYWSRPSLVKVDLRVVMKRPQKKNYLVKGRSRLEKRFYWPLCAVCWIAKSCHSFERGLFICVAVSWFLPLFNYPQATVDNREAIWLLAASSPEKRKVFAEPSRAQKNFDNQAFEGAFGILDPLKNEKILPALFLVCRFEQLALLIWCWKLCFCTILPDFWWASNKSLCLMSNYQKNCKFFYDDFDISYETSVF